MLNYAQAAAQSIYVPASQTAAKSGKNNNQGFNTTYKGISFRIFINPKTGVVANVYPK